MGLVTVGEEIRMAWPVVGKGGRMEWNLWLKGSEVAEEIGQREEPSEERRNQTK